MSANFVPWGTVNDYYTRANLYFKETVYDCQNSKFPFSRIRPLISVESVLFSRLHSYMVPYVGEFALIFGLNYAWVCIKIMMQCNLYRRLIIHIVTHFSIFWEIELAEYAKYKYWDNVLFIWTSKWLENGRWIMVNNFLIGLTTTRLVTIKKGSKTKITSSLHFNFLQAHFDRKFNLWTGSDLAVGCRK